MGFERLVMGLRALELAFALIVVGLAGNFIATGGDPTNKDADASTRHRFIYTIIVACIASILALVWLFPFTANFTQWPSDIVISILWWVAFGLLVNALPSGCRAFFNSKCGSFKAAVAFCFLSALLWLASAGIGGYLSRRRGSQPAAAKTAGAKQSGWFSRSKV
ncbi:hypothetical protein E4U13_005693 [Claviceps humidiphila]|uniref:MARVEL domain-containing protein n=1 Tax=Claviceps humidiphila TaxID=1294629 RepID=A0A9P7TVZ4_9HYPO|nr:hypothetical protein E4U32_008194 [Claviceps aff. humidiphila group G2b]KAG6120936.1 hypothetical protein E4U13_005693 [Claviceps humidiphila]